MEKSKTILSFPIRIRIMEGISKFFLDSFFSVTSSIMVFIHLLASATLFLYLYYICFSFSYSNSFVVKFTFIVA